MKKVWVRLTHLQEKKKKSYSEATVMNAKNMIKNNKGHQVIKLDYAPFYYVAYRWIIKWDNLKWILTTILAPILLLLLQKLLK
jgi:hypothetical protein